MEQSTKKIGLINWVVLLAGVVSMLLISQYAASSAALVGTALLASGLIAALISYFQMGLIEREQFEKMELDELAKSRGSQSLFADAGDDTFPAKRSREIFERYFVPGLSVLLLALQAGAVWFLWLRLRTVADVANDRVPLAMSLLGLIGMILFLLGKYSTGLVRLQRHKFLRPGATYMLLGAYVCFFVIVALAVGSAGFNRADSIAAKVLCVVLGLIATETLVSLVLEIYRVRVRGGESRLLYESRLVGVMGQPEAIFITAKQTLDYQFGFKVSDHWFAQFLGKSIWWMILGQLAILVLSTCVVEVESGDQALLERFGRPVAGGVLEPGLHFKLPWPVDQTVVYHTDQVQSFIVGAEPDSRKTVVWKVAHGKEENFIVASRDKIPMLSTNDSSATIGPPVNLMSVSIPIQYQITNLTEWAYVNRDPDALLKGAAQREVVEYLASADFDEIMSRGRGAAAATLHAKIQGMADTLHLGVRIRFVGLEDIHPPQKVAESFEKVVGAAQAKEAKILDAQAYVRTTNAWAEGQASNRVWAAEAGYYAEKVNSAARADLFTNQVLAYSAAPGRNGIYETRAKLETWVNSSRQIRKYVIATTNTPDILIFDLEDKIRRELIDDLPAPPKK